MKQCKGCLAHSHNGRCYYSALYGKPNGLYTSVSIRTWLKQRGNIKCPFRRSK